MSKELCETKLLSKELCKIMIRSNSRKISSSSSKFRRNSNAPNQTFSKFFRFLDRSDNKNDSQAFTAFHFEATANRLKEKIFIPNFAPNKNFMRKNCQKLRILFKKQKYERNSRSSTTKNIWKAEIQ